MGRTGKTICTPCTGFGYTHLYTAHPTRQPVSPTRLDCLNPLMSSVQPLMSSVSHRFAPICLGYVFSYTDSTPFTIMPPHPRFHSLPLRLCPSDPLSDHFCPSAHNFLRLPTTSYNFPRLLTGFTAFNYLLTPPFSLAPARQILDRPLLCLTQTATSPFPQSATPFPLCHCTTDPLLCPPLYPVSRSATATY